MTAIINLKAARLDRIAARINAAHAAAEDASRRVVEHAAAAGRLLIEAKESMPYGSWSPWLKANIELSPRSIQRYMKLSRALDAMTAQEATRVAGLPLREALRAIVGGVSHSDFPPGSEQWFTPAGYIERARAVMGRIDLDPASCKQAQKTVQAKAYYSVAQNGLRQKWQGRVFMNPPFSASKIGLFVGKLLDEYQAGNVTEAILLTNSQTDARWFGEIAKHASAICFAQPRIKFVQPDGQARTTGLHGQAFAYLGRNTARFKKEFAPIGFILFPG